MARTDSLDTTTTLPFDPQTKSSPSVLDSRLRMATPRRTRLSLAQWDSEVAPYLHIIERAGREVASATEKMGHAVRVLQSRPDWLTKAGDELERAEQLAVANLERIRNALAGYAALPVAE
jgi:hypothetical protein